MNLRLILLIIIMLLSITDLVITGYYIYKYKKWQPNKPFKEIEQNPILRFLLNKLGLFWGMFVGSIIILTLNYLVAKDAHWVIALLVLAFLVYTIINNISNLSLLFKLIAKYPSGYLPLSIFGLVEGNNKRMKGGIKNVRGIKRKTKGKN